MTPDDLDLLSAAGRPSLTPGGDVAVVAVRRPDLDSDAYLGSLWAVPTDGSPAWRLTSGPRDSSPAVSPDGRRVAFLRAGEDAPPQLHLTGLYGGEPLRLTDHPLGAGDPVWSPDGARLAYAARVPEPGRYGTEDAEGRTVKPEAEPPRLITTAKYRQDDVGFTRDRRTHLFVVDVPDEAAAGAEPPAPPPTPRQLTTGDADDRGPSWSPDGSRLSFVSSRHETREEDLRTAVHVVGLDGQGPDPHPRAVTGGDVSVSAARWLPDGRLVLALGSLGESGRDFVGRCGTLWVSAGPVGEGAVEVRPLTSEEQHDLEAADAADLVVAGGRVVVRDLHRGAVRLLGIDPGSGDVEVLLEGRLVASGQAATADGSVLVASVATPERVGDLAVVRDGAPVWLTDLSAPLRATGLRPPVEVEATSADGHPVHGWAFLPDPAAYGEGPHPTLLTIHGGPFTQYGWGLFDETQVYAAAGYAVVMCNPRGSEGYGPDHGRSILHRMGTVDADDVLAFLDHALADPGLALDGERVGVMGGSYGGYLTATLTTRTERFAGAIVERGYLDGGSFVGSSDIGWFFPGGYHGSPGAAVEQTPMRDVGKVSTPTLVIHSEHDWRTPVEQGLRWWNALRAGGVRTELLLFPGEGHELTRSGRPRHRRQRFEHVLRWWGEVLPVDGAGPA